MTTTVACHDPRPATEITPPVTYSLPTRDFLSKWERRAKSRRGEPTLGPVRAPYVSKPYTGTTRIWDPVKKEMVALKDLSPNPTSSRLPSSSDVPSEYHLRISEIAPNTKIYTPCSKRPCTEADHVDLDGKVVRWKGTSRRASEVVDVPLVPSRRKTDSVTTRSLVLPPSTVSTPPTSTETTPSSQTVSRLGPATDIVPGWKVSEDGTCEVIARPRLHLRGSKRFHGTLLPSFRPPM